MHGTQKKSALILLFQGLLVGTLASGAETTPPLTQGLIFLQSFDADGTAFLQGGLAHPFTLATNDLVSGRFGSGYQFEVPYENLLLPEVATPTQARTGFIAGPGVTLQVATGGVASQPLLAAETTTTGLLWQSQAVELKNLPNPHRPVKAFLASVYLRAHQPGVKIRLLIQDDIESTDWQQPLLDANETLVKKSPEARLTPPVATICRTQDVTLAADWQRVTADIRVDTRRPVQQLRIALIQLDPASAVVEASAMQIEHYLRFPNDKAYAGPWIPGGTRRESNALRMPLQRMGFNGKAGALACWMRLPPVDGNGSRSGSVCVHVGGGWWAPVWRIGTGTCHAGDSGHSKYTSGQSLIQPHGLKMNDGAWHHLALTWEPAGCVLYSDGSEVGRAEYHFKEADPTDPLIMGATTLNGDHCDAVLDEVALWNRALNAEEIMALQMRTNSLAASLPPWLMAYPERLVFHRGEADASLAFQWLPLQLAAMPKKVRLQIPAFGVQRTWRPNQQKPTRVPLHPWQAKPGHHTFTASSDNGALAVSNTLEIVDALPSRDFVILAWSSGANLRDYGFTAELAGAHALEVLLRRSMLSSLRIDARAWHPLDPAHLPVSLDTAAQAAHQAAAYPNVYASMVNTEVGLSALPEAPWFQRWMRDQTGLDQVPQEVRLNPVRVTSTNELPAIIPNSDPTLRFIRWLQREGKGWPSLNAQLAETMRRKGLDGVMFYTDQPQVVADARGLEALDYWDYPHVSSGLVVEFNRVCTIARLARCKISLMPGTIFWDPWPVRVKEQIACLSPDLMRQYLWVAVASPLDHLGVYGMGEFRKEYVPPGCDDALRRTLHEVYPIGLLTGGLPQGGRKIAYLRTDGLYWHGAGDNQWIDSWFTRATTRALAEARIRFDMINDEHVEAGWLGRYDSVVLTGVERIPETTHQRLVAFLAAGGQVVVDRRCRAALPGATVLEYAGRNRADDAVRALQAWAKEQQAAHPEPLRLRNSDEAWLFDKSDGMARFVFIVNDRMTPGHLGRELGLKANLGTSTGPLRDQGERQHVVLSVPTVESGTTLYDVRKHAALATTNSQVELDLLPGDAALLAVLPQPIRDLDVALPRRLRAGDEDLLKITIRGADGRLIKHRDLVEVLLMGADGVPMALPRYHRVNQGKVEIPIRLPRTTAPGTAILTVTEWIAGQRATRELRILPL